MNGTSLAHFFFGGGGGRSPPCGALGRGQKFNILNMVMWHIKFKGESSRHARIQEFLSGGGGGGSTSI